MLFFLASCAIYKDLRMASASIEWFVEDWFIWGRCHTFCVYCISSINLELQPGHKEDLQHSLAFSGCC